MSAELSLAPQTPVAAALNYATFCATAGIAKGGYPDLWVSKYPSPSPGDRVIGLDPRRAGEGKPGTATRPELCMQILAAEVRRRQEADKAILRLIHAAKRVDDYHACRLGAAVPDVTRYKIYEEHAAALAAVLPFFALTNGGFCHGAAPVAPAVVEEKAA